MTGNSTAPGIIPRAISEIFSIIEATAAEESDVFFYVRLSYVELYNNNFRNLLEFASKELAAKERAAEREE
jgi:kinesin family protein 22